jgi:DNA-binding CsgD family transcriptional regulator/tetratricopeptide (TPR) repeat protein
VARRLYREVAAAPGEPLRLAVVGVGGAGKTVLLAALARAYTEAGVPVSRDPLAKPRADAVLLVDDAHRLPDPELVELTVLARSAEARLIVAHRPWPRPGALAGLVGELAEARAPLVLPALDRAGVAGRAAMRLAHRPPAALVDFVAEQTGGSPALTERLLHALEDAGALAADPFVPKLPAGLIEQLHYEMDRLPAGVRNLLLALAVGAPPDVDVLSALLDEPAEAVAELAEQARAAGVLAEGGAPRPLLARAVLRRAPSVRRLTARRRLAEVQLERGASVLAAAANLLDTGATGAKVAAVFEAAADEALRGGSPLAGRLFDAAVAAGAPPARLAARAAEAAARAGHLDRALELADRVLAAPEEFGEADRSRAVAVAAAALAQRGLLARSAELYRWLGDRAMGVVAVPALIGTGALAEAAEVLDPPALDPADPAAGPPRPPTLLAGAEALTARGVYDSIVGSPTAALSQLARAAALLEPTGGAVLLPDTPAALAALVAAHGGELDVARSVLDRAVAAGLGGRLAVHRHRLLQAWTAMARGATGTARALLAEVDADAARRAGENGSGRLEPRDELVAAALQVGLARRAGDLAALMPAWTRAREAIVRHPVDLYALAPLGELIVAAARLREQPWVRPHLDEAHALLARLGHPPLWSVTLYWAELHAALQAEQWAEAQRQAEALDAAERGAGGVRYASAMAVAARCWLAVLRGEVDPVAVEAAARALHAVGLSWDGGKLAGQAAIRTTDRKAMVALLACARGMQNSVIEHLADPASPSAGDRAAPAVPAAPTDPSNGRGGPALAREPAARPAPVAEPNGALSDREREVAELVLDGLTYKQIGERLFISAKTVEHHVARMRQRLGSNSRGELMAHLRMIVGGR